MKDIPHDGLKSEMLPECLQPFWDSYLEVQKEEFELQPIKLVGIQFCCLEPTHGIEDMSKRLDPDGGKSHYFSKVQTCLRIALPDIFTYYGRGKNSQEQWR